MKNAIIALLSLALVFFIVRSLGGFDYGSGVDSNHRTHFVEKRVKAVEKSPAWVFAAGYDAADPLASGCAEGMKFAVDMLNGRGGVLGRPVRLVTEGSVGDRVSQRLAVQKACDDMATAVYFGPSETHSVPSVRALSQFQGLPCVSVMTPTDPRWPRLEADNFVTFFPSLSLLASVVGRDVARQGHRKVLVVSPETGTYGWLFANAVESDVRDRVPGVEVFRFNYQGVLTREALLRALDLYNENRGVEAVVYTGELDGLLVLDALQRGMGTAIPVYGSDLLAIADQKLETVERLQEPELAGSVPVREAGARAFVRDLYRRLAFSLFVPEFEPVAEYPDFASLWREKKGRGPDVWEILGASAVLTTARALESLPSYHPDRLVEAVRGELASLRAQRPPMAGLTEYAPAPSQGEGAAR